MLTTFKWLLMVCMVYSVHGGFCSIPEFPQGDINIAQAIDPCCFGSSIKCKNQHGVGVRGNFRLSDIKPDVILSCTGKDFHCTRCPNGLYFSEKCNACLEYLNDYHNVCPPPIVVKKMKKDKVDEDVDLDFCKKEPFNGLHTGNLVDPKNPHYYYACVYHVTYHMPCPKGLSYNEHKDACL